MYPTRVLMRFFLSYFFFCIHTFNSILFLAFLLKPNRMPIIWTGLQCDDQYDDSTNSRSHTHTQGAMRRILM